ncbi:TPA: phosphoribosyltransferase-like protein, partial [Staphylococcus aureus]
LSQKFLIKQTDFYIITYAGIELLKKYGLEKITLSNILYEFKSNGLHQQKNFDGNK